MTVLLAPQAVAQRIQEAIPGALEEWRGGDVWVKPEQLLEVCRFLKEDRDLGMDYLVAVTGVDYVDHFEVVYHLNSIRHNHATVLKARLHGREGPAVPSVVSLWQGADLQEREVWDLMGIAFTGHPNLKRILTWDGFPGHPLQKSHLGG
jgi:NADH-quinone oxidoreductase subunit C